MPMQSNNKINTTTSIYLYTSYVLEDSVCNTIIRNWMHLANTEVGKVGVEVTCWLAGSSTLYCVYTVYIHCTWDLISSLGETGVL